MRVDIGFGDHVYPLPKRGKFPSLLPDLPQANILMYPPETVVAEKFEAMIRFGEANGRIKDFYDIWVTARTFPFGLANMVEAVSGTLRRRETAIPTEMPVGLTEAFAAIAEGRGLWAVSCAAIRPTSNRRLSPNCKRNCGASSPPSSPASGHRKVPTAAGTRTVGLGAKVRSKRLDSELI